MLRLADLQKKIDETTEEMCHITQDDQDRRPKHMELHQDNSFKEDEWYDDFHHGNFTFDDASPLTAELLWLVKLLVSFRKPSPSLIEGCLPMV
jgi:hypothetical protein